MTLGVAQGSKILKIFVFLFVLFFRLLVFWDESSDQKTVKMPLKNPAGGSFICFALEGQLRMV